MTDTEKWSEHNTNTVSTHVCKEYEVNPENSTQLNWVAWAYTRCSHMHTALNVNQLLQLTIWIMRHMHSHLGLQISIQF